MPWVRLDEHALNHVKILVLSDGAFRLWVEGLAHCQKHLTDGAISTGAVVGFRYAKRGRIAELAASVDGLPALWETTKSGHTVHDYLKWNDSREQVLKARALAKERITRMRERRGNGVTTRERTVLSTVTPLRGVYVYGSSGSEKEKGPRELSPADRPDLTERAGRFLERYADLHAKLRHGARYVGKMHHDFAEALQLVAAYDDARLDKLVSVWMKTDHDFAENGTRSVPKFRSMISWCDEKLIAWESTHGAIQVQP